MACLDNIKRPDIQVLTEDENEFEEHIQKIRYPLTLCYKHTHNRHIKAIICRGADTTVFCMMFFLHDVTDSARRQGERTIFRWPLRYEHCRSTCPSSL